MCYLLGLDPSLAKTGYAILNLKDLSNNIPVEKGLLKTSNSDGILIQRLLKQQKQIQGIIKKYDITYVGMEAPYFGGHTAEILFSLNQFIHKTFYDRGSYVIAFPPQMLKKLVFPDKSVSDIHKPQMIHEAKSKLDLHGKTLAEDVADAYWAGYFGKKYINWHIFNTINDSDLNAYEKTTFFGKHTYTRGARKGLVEYNGIKFRDNELFFDFKAIKRRHKNAKSKGCKEKGSNKAS